MTGEWGSEELGGCIVVGFAAKPEGEAALQRAVLEARLRGGRLVVVSSRRPDESQEALARTDAELAAADAVLAESGVAYDIRRLEGETGAADDLVDIAESLKAELIVIGLKRRSPAGKLILGTQAQKILLDAPCPVLAVKA